ncbi:MAG TPA: HlyD family efflux transporter periplasmic adaptor subunit [Aquabacterium sp.]|uniref:HlyD family secretion protein n=1 Tax=Aquabacterium sp. TaxID=1872578 RepID=UPI002E32DC0C|nr:HlyD family efflux transporter periplasmic adaptor subunit [Aquabacterium sp.]HEX5372044.1 HlyD family efflux transporter periplasmic adaptor subunit [Aquabacterium sp.]
MKYRGFVLGALTSTLTLSAAWTAYAVMNRDEGPNNIVQVNGRLEVQRVEIATKFAGQVSTVNVNEGDQVKVGDVIAQMDPSDYVGQLEGVYAMKQRALKARARAEGERDVQSIKASVAQLELDSAYELRKQVLISDSELQKRKAQRDGETRGIGIATAAMGEALAASEEADAGIKRLQTAIKDHTLRAPVTGRVEYRVVEPGSVIPAGGRVATVLDTSHVHMTIYLPSAASGRVRVGDDARIVLDAAPDLRLPAKVAFVSAEAQFTPKHVETPAEREKLSYRVRLALSEETAMKHAGLLKAGLTGNGFVKLHSESTQDDWPGDVKTSAAKSDDAW